MRMDEISHYSTKSGGLYFACSVILGQRMVTNAGFSLSSLSPSNCPILDKKELHEAHPWFEFLVQCRGVAANPRGRRGSHLCAAGRVFGTAGFNSPRCCKLFIDRDKSCTCASIPHL